MNESPSGGDASGPSTDFKFLSNSVTIAEGCEVHLSFHQFQELPLELRENICAYSLPQQRLLTIAVTSTDNADPASYRYCRENILGNTVSDANYHLRLESTVVYLKRPIWSVSLSTVCVLPEQDD